MGGWLADSWRPSMMAARQVPKERQQIPRQGVLERRSDRVGWWGMRVLGGAGRVGSSPGTQNGTKSVCEGIRGGRASMAGCAGRAAHKRAAASPTEGCRAAGGSLGSSLGSDSSKASRATLLLRSHLGLVLGVGFHHPDVGGAVAACRVGGVAPRARSKAQRAFAAVWAGSGRLTVYHCRPRGRKAGWFSQKRFRAALP